jgi:hypothetical protein
MSIDIAGDGEGSSEFREFIGLGVTLFDSR